MIIRLILKSIYILRLILGPQGYCKFKLSCTDYAENELKTNSFYKAIFNILIRLLSCNPLLNFRVKQSCKNSGHKYSN